MQVFQAIFVALLALGLPSRTRSSPPPPGAYSVQLPQLLLQSMVFLGNASFGRTGQIELNNPILSTSSSPTPTRSNGRALYNLPLKLINPSTSFFTSFTFATLHPSELSFVVAPNNQDLTTSYGFSVRLTTTNNSVTVWSGSQALAAANAEVNLGLDSRRTFVWITYDSKLTTLDVKVNNLSSLPPTSLISIRMNTAGVFNQYMFVGFSAFAPMTSSKTTIYAWNFTSWLSSPVSHPDPAAVTGMGSKRARNLVVTGIAVAALAVSFCAGVLIIRHVRSSSASGKMSKSLSRSEKDDQNSSFLRRFTFKELVSATNNFELSNRLGACPNVSQCYRGVLSDCMVAVKIVSQTDPVLVQENWKLVSEFASLRHRNLINLLGFCSSNSTSKSMLVYEFVPNSSLDEHLFSKAPGHPTLPWSHRHKAALGLAQGLEYLHSRGLVHGNVKSSNVLLDSNFTPRLGDYSLKNRMGSRNQPVAGTMIVAGTFGYVAPEAVQTGRPTTQADVFAFGAVVLELVCGRRALEAEGGHAEEEECVTVLVDRVWEVLKEERFEVVVDSKLGTLYDVSEMEAMVTVGLACSDYDPERRPSMDVVLKMLTGEVGLPSLKSLTERKGKLGEEMKKNKKQEEDETQRTIEELLVMKDFGSLFN